MSATISSIKETILVPRFYKTDFKALKDLNLKNFNLEVTSLFKEHQNDYNKNHFIYNPAPIYQIKINPVVIAFLLRSCLAEFSGFLLYTEISKNTHLITKNLLQKIFKVLARDEARHAGIINTYLNEFKLNLNLGKLTKTRPYTYFLPRYVYYSVFLSEKIGYSRYITIARFLNYFPKYLTHPIFKYFISWCQDENRHGDFFSLFLKSHRHLLTGPLARLWTRFFLLVVYLTMITNDKEREEVFKFLGMDAFVYDLDVIQQTNLVASKLFPVALNLSSPLFLKTLTQFLTTFIKLKGDSQNKKISPILFIKTLFKCISLSSKLFILEPIIRKKSLFKERYL